MNSKKLVAEVAAIIWPSMDDQSARTPEDLAQEIVALVIPEGYRLVPVVPTEAMLRAALQHVYFYDTNIDGKSEDQIAEARLVYRAMLNAAPEPKE